MLRASVLNFVRLDILRDWIGHPSKKLLSFEYAQSFCFQFRVSRYIMGLNHSSELKVIAVCICYEHPFSISSVSIYYGTQSEIRVKSYCPLNLLRAFVFNLERLDILRDSIGHPNIKLLSFEFDTSFRFQFAASRYITGLSGTSELKVIVVWIWYELPISIWSVSIYYGTLSEIRVKSYCRLNLIRASNFNLERLDILRESIGHPSKKLLSIEFDTSFRFQFAASRYITWLSRTSEKNLLLFEFCRSFCFQFRASRYIIGLNRTSKLKVIVVCFGYELPFSNSSVSIYYGTQLDIRI